MTTKAKTIQEKVKVTKEQVSEALKEDPHEFAKSQLVKSRKYADRRDALNALLKDDQKYTFTQVDEILKQFYEGGNK